MLLVVNGVTLWCRSHTTFGGHRCLPDGDRVQTWSNGRWSVRMFPVWTQLHAAADHKPCDGSRVRSRWAMLSCLCLLQDAEELFIYVCVLLCKGTHFTMHISTMFNLMFLFFVLPFICIEPLVFICFTDLGELSSEIKELRERVREGGTLFYFLLWAIWTLKIEK